MGFNAVLINFSVNQGNNLKKESKPPHPSHYNGMGQLFGALPLNAKWQAGQLPFLKSKVWPDSGLIVSLPRPNLTLYQQRYQGWLNEPSEVSKY